MNRLRQTEGASYETFIGGTQVTVAYKEISGHVEFWLSQIRIGTPSLKSVPS
jgi:hypothetical protein